MFILVLQSIAATALIIAACPMVAVFVIVLYFLRIPWLTVLGILAVSQLWLPNLALTVAFVIGCWMFCALFIYMSRPERKPVQYPQGTFRMILRFLEVGICANYEKVIAE